METQFLRGGGKQSVVDRAVNNYRYDCFELSPVLALTNYANEVERDYVLMEYGRYWHGYLVPLKLLLLFFDYSDIRILNFFFQNFLLYFILKGFYKNRLERYVSAFLPIGWMFVLADHTAEHYWFTHKLFSISVFALLSLGIYLLSDLETDFV